MSHITKINLLIKDLDALDKACSRLGLELVRGQKTFKWYGRFVGDSLGIAGVNPADYGKCEHAIRVKGNVGAYEIGLVKRADDKGYDLHWDNYQGGYGLAEKVGYETGARARVGAKATKLADWYAAEVARKQMARQGFMVKMVQREKRVQVLCSK